MQKESQKFSRKYRSIFIVFGILALLDVVIWQPILFFRESGNLELYFLDVGQGDSELIILPTGVKILSDGGPPNTKVLSQLSKILPPTDNYIDLLIMSHPQLDHFGGFIDVLKNYKIGAFIGNGREGTAAAYNELADVIKSKQVPYIKLMDGDAIKNGDSKFSVLSPNEENLESKELNDTSIVMQLEHNGLKVLYTGDIGFNIEDYLTKKDDLHSQVFKVPHHGSKFSSGSAFLNAVQPQVSVIEVGKNSYGHPTGEVLGRLADTDTQVFRTDKDGTVKIVVEDSKLRIYRSR